MEEPLGKQRTALVSIAAATALVLLKLAVTKIDRRYRPPRAHEAVEVEALGQGVVTSVIRAALNSLLPEPLEDVQVRELVERAHVTALLAGWR